MKDMPKRLAGEVASLFMDLTQRFEKRPYLGDQTIAEISDILGNWSNEVKPRQHLHKAEWTISRAHAPILSIAIHLQRKMDTEVNKFHLTLGMRNFTAPTAVVYDRGVLNPLITIPFDEFNKLFRTIVEERGYDPNKLIAVQVVGKTSDALREEEVVWNGAFDVTLMLSNMKD